MLQYADDTVLMIECSDKYILHMKFLLYCFEWISGLKINYHKSEVFVMGVNRSESLRVANMLDCRLGTLPLNYLGFVIGDKVVMSQSAGKIISKLDSRLDNWKSNLLSSGGRLILVNSCLSSIPTYTMGFYRLNVEAHRGMDTIRSRFFWRGAAISSNTIW